MELPPTQQRDALLDLIPELISKYGDVAADASAQWYEQLRSRWFTDGYVADLPRQNDDVSQLIRWKAGILFGDEPAPDAMLRWLYKVVDRGVKQGGRSTIVFNARRDPRKPRWARIPQGRTCAFCGMLASRGFKYASASTAGATNRFHPDCDCMIVPSWDGDRSRVAGFDMEPLSTAFDLAREKAGTYADESSILSAMRAMFPGRFNDSDKVVNDSVHDDGE